MKYLIYIIGILLMIIYIFKNKNIETFKINELSTEMKKDVVKVFNNNILLRNDDVYKKNNNPLILFTQKFLGGMIKKNGAELLLFPPY